MPKKPMNVLLGKLAVSKPSVSFNRSKHGCVCVCVCFISMREPAKDMVCLPFALRILTRNTGSGREIQAPFWS